MAKQTTQANDESITVRLPGELLTGVDDLRRAEPSLPTRAGMIRLLIERAIEAQQKKRR
jgi:metal-responsive CopG/Arc/MetJ family transcriptional regulator